MSLPPCRRYHPAEVDNRINQLSVIHAAFALRLQAQPPGILTFGATRAFSLITARRLAHHPNLPKCLELQTTFGDPEKIENRVVKSDLLRYKLTSYCAILIREQILGRPYLLSTALF